MARLREEGASLQLDRSVQEICWLYAFAGSNPALSKPCITADSQPPELISRHRENKNKLLSLYPITSHNRCAEFGFLTQLDTNPIRRTMKPDRNPRKPMVLGVTLTRKNNPIVTVRSNSRALHVPWHRKGLVQ